MADVDQVRRSVRAGAPATSRRLVLASAVCAAVAVGAIAGATITGTHAFWAFAIWVAATAAAVATGLVALARLPRIASTRALRRVATAGVVVGVLCATLGLAVYSSTRSSDCPPDRPCDVPASGPGQRDQAP